MLFFHSIDEIQISKCASGRARRNWHLLPFQADGIERVKCTRAPLQNSIEIGNQQTGHHLHSKLGGGLSNLVLGHACESMPEMFHQVKEEGISMLVSPQLLYRRSKVQARQANSE